MNEYDPNEMAEETEATAPIQVDTFGMRVKIAPPKTLDNAPLTWAEVRADANQTFMRICRDLPGFVADLFTGARNIVRGISVLPAATAKRIAGAHRTADRKESIASECAKGVADQRAANIAVHQARGLLAELNAQGIATNMSVSPNGTLLVSIVRPELSEAASEAVSESAAMLEATGAPAKGPANVMSAAISVLGLGTFLENRLRSFGLLTVRDVAVINDEFMIDNFIPDDLLTVGKALEQAGVASSAFSNLTEFFNTDFPESLLTPPTRDALKILRINNILDFSMAVNNDTFVGYRDEHPDQIADMRAAVLEVRRRMRGTVR
jgi:hypothetical protein